MRASWILLLPDRSRGNSRQPVVAGRLRAGAVLAAAMAVSACSDSAQAGPQAGVVPGYGTSCYAEFYMCRLPQQAPAGGQCTCPGIGAPSYGTVR